MAYGILLNLGHRPADFEGGIRDRCRRDADINWLRRKRAVVVWHVDRLAPHARPNRRDAARAVFIVLCVLARATGAHGIDAHIDHICGDAVRPDQSLLQLVVQNRLVERAHVRHLLQCEVDEALAVHVSI
eukprot:7276746-Prymnesium_polylepis.1